MKNIVLLFVIALTLVSCSKNETEDDVVVSDYYGKWDQFAEAPYSNDASSTQFSYRFNKDNTFTKTRNYDNKIATLSGTFEIKTNENTTVFVLTYPEQNFLISSCTGGLTESFTLDKSGHLNDNAGMCDRYGKYKKAK
ncbi:hypothetical protein [[Flexibacter] sp. ATCC 35103]|uniref:hypothetical protein n=1 Tax=[Flexibacter] sp. ATCC 35103 TaxID=1937528 RepID=UPI0009C934E1|nr:hypothetical protein [[Flexibacter] sp. ATCC 35103]OMQ08979.1 hypothetical protein BXU01_18690 [[Flexibacter] sp. ATCC 35103]